MNTLPLPKKLLILQSLVEGNSIRSIERISGVHRDTILRLLVFAGMKAEEIMNQKICNIKSNYLEIDEQWCFIGKKQRNLTADEKANSDFGDQYVFVALDPETKLVPYFCVGKRNSNLALYLLEELKKRIITHFQLSTDAFVGYLEAVELIFRNNIDYATIHKQYGSDTFSKGRYSPPHIVKITKREILGEPKESRITTSHIERLNLSTRMMVRRFTRLTNAFSKKLENLKCACSLHFYYYNFMRIHQTLRITPAMESKITNHIWSWEEFLGTKKQMKEVA